MARFLRRVEVILVIDTLLYLIENRCLSIYNNKVTLLSRKSG